MPVEVFSTNVDNHTLAGEIIQMLITCLPGYLAGFDLEDCDRILRIAAPEQPMDDEIITFLFNSGMSAASLPDVIPLPKPNHTP